MSFGRCTTISYPVYLKTCLTSLLRVWRSIISEKKWMILKMWSMMVLYHYQLCLEVFIQADTDLFCILAKTIVCKRFGFCRITNWTHNIENQRTLFTKTQENMFRTLLYIHELQINSGKGLLKNTIIAYYIDTASVI